MAAVAGAGVAGGDEEGDEGGGGGAAPGLVRACSAGDSMVSERR